MELQKIGQTDCQGSRIALGCMRLAALDLASAKEVLKTAVDTGMTFIDHADIYGGGQSEVRFRDATKPWGYPVISLSCRPNAVFVMAILIFLKSIFCHRSMQV